MRHETIQQLGAVEILMTREERLKHWAALVRAHGEPVFLVHMLEALAPYHLETTDIARFGKSTALGIAASDPVFQAQGLNLKSTIGDAMRFFSLTAEELHAFSCDCGGVISNNEQADRIDRLAAH